MTMRIATLMLLALPATVLAQNGHPLEPAATPEEVGFSGGRLARIDSMVDDLVAQKKIPGAVVYIARHGKVAYHKAWGYRDAETRDPLRKDDIFRMASQTKAVASLAVMMLWEEGKFGLDDPVSRYIPEFAKPTVLKTFNPADSSYTTEPAGREITIRQLLTHTSGIDYAAIGHDEFKAIYAKAGVPSGIGNDRYTIGDKMKVLAKLPLRSKPGTEFNYSLSIDVLGYLVEVVSGMPFDRFLRTRIFDPLGMNDTWFYLPKNRADRLVSLHNAESGTAVPMKDRVFDGVDPDYPRLAGTYFSGGAGLSGSIEDYARFLQLFVNGGEYNGVRLLSPKTVQLMLTNQTPGMNTEFGLGFGLETEDNDYRSPKSVGSFSWGGAFATTYWADPKEDLVALIYTNMYNNRTVNYADRFTTFTYAAIER
jgi:CubicO group peptidase (beta-lactamase class C family)